MSVAWRANAVEAKVVVFHTCPAQWTVTGEDSDMNVQATVVAGLSVRKKNPWQHRVVKGSFGF